MTVTRLHGALVPAKFAQKTDVSMERTPALIVARGFSNPCTFCTSARDTLLEETDALASPETSSFCTADISADTANVTLSRDP